MKEANKRAKEAEERAAAAEPYKEQFLSIQKPKVFEEAGVDVRLATLYNGNLTPEEVKTWASGLGFAPTAAEPEAETQGATGTFAPTVGGDVPGNQKVPRSTLDQLAKEGNFQEMNRLLREGRVEWNHPDEVNAATGR